MAEREFLLNPILFLPSVFFLHTLIYVLWTWDPLTGSDDDVVENSLLNFMEKAMDEGCVSDGVMAKDPSHVKVTRLDVFEGR